MSLGIKVKLSLRICVFSRRERARSKTQHSRCRGKAVSIDSNDSQKYTSSKCCSFRCESLACPAAFLPLSRSSYGRIRFGKTGADTMMFGRARGSEGRFCLIRGRWKKLHQQPQKRTFFFCGCWCNFFHRPLVSSSRTCRTGSQCFDFDTPRAVALAFLTKNLIRWLSVWDCASCCT